MPITMGLLSLLSANVLLLATARSLKVDRCQAQEESSAIGGEYEPQEEQAVYYCQPTRQAKAMWWEYVHSFLALVAKRKVILVLLTGYWVRMLAASVKCLQLIYVSRLFDWSYSKVCPSASHTCVNRAKRRQRIRTNLVDRPPTSCPSTAPST